MSGTPGNSPLQPSPSWPSASAPESAAAPPPPKRRAMVLGKVTCMPTRQPHVQPLSKAMLLLRPCVRPGVHSRCLEQPLLTMAAGARSSPDGRSAGSRVGATADGRTTCARMQTSHMYQQHACVSMGVVESSAPRGWALFDRPLRTKAAARAPWPVGSAAAPSLGATACGCTPKGQQSTNHTVCQTGTPRGADGCGGRCSSSCSRARASERRPAVTLPAVAPLE